MQPHSKTTADRLLQPDSFTTQVDNESLQTLQTLLSMGDYSAASSTVVDWIQQKLDEQE